MRGRGRAQGGREQEEGWQGTGAGTGNRIIRAPGSGIGWRGKKQLSGGGVEGARMNNGSTELDKR